MNILNRIPKHTNKFKKKNSFLKISKSLTTSRRIYKINSIEFGFSLIQQDFELEIYSKNNKFVAPSALSIHRIGIIIWWIEYELYTYMRGISKYTRCWCPFSLTLRDHP